MDYTAFWRPTEVSRLNKYPFFKISPRDFQDKYGVQRVNIMKIPNQFRRIALIILASATSLTACTKLQPSAHPVTISISPLDATHIKAEYRFSTSCETIALANLYGNRTAELRKDWSLIGPCGTLTPDGKLTQDAACKSVAISVPIQATHLDRIYPPAFPLGDKGVLIHTGIFARDGTCGNAQWQFKSPNGSLVMGGKNKGAHIILETSAGSPKSAQPLGAPSKS